VTKQGGFRRESNGNSINLQNTSLHILRLQIFTTLNTLNRVTPPANGFVLLGGRQVEPVEVAALPIAIIRIEKDLIMLNGIRVSRLIELSTVAALSLALLLSVSSPLKAESLVDDKAVVTFDHPVEVPGKVLPPGTYVFKSLENNGLVQVFSADERQLFATLSVVPEDRPAHDPDVDSFVQLNKTRADAPQEVEGFFLAGHLTGFQFVYPSAHANHHRS
jgi:hypothetical protein